MIGYTRMSQTNPYEPPDKVVGSHDDSDEDIVSTSGTNVSRVVAAMFDGTFALILSLVAAKLTPENLLTLHIVVIVSVYIGYFFVFEGFFARTPGKFIMRLAVAQLDGRRCTWKQVAIRTAYRLLEVNPLLLGAVPAAICIVSSKHRQRIGDRVAGTVVTFARRLRRK